MERKKILITIDWFLPGTKSGGPVRSYANMIAHLGSHFDFYIITRDTDYCSNEVYETIVSNQWNAFNDHTWIYYISESQLNKHTLKQLFKETAFDHVMVNGVYSWYFSILPVYYLKKRHKILVSARGMLNPQAFSVKPFKKKVFLSIAKLFGLYNNVTFHATNSDEANCIKSVIGNSTKVRVASNLPRPIDQVLPIQKTLSNPVSYVNISRVSIEKGTLKMITALQRVKHPMVLDIYGPIYDESYWEKCQEAMKALPSHVTLNYKGSLDSEDVMHTLASYNFFVLLSEGENFGHAILEALSMGCPVIISDKTPWKNLQQKGIGWDINNNDINALDNVFEVSSTMDSEKYGMISKNAHTFAKAFSQNEDLITQNKNLFK